MGTLDIPDYNPMYPPMNESLGRSETGDVFGSSFQNALESTPLPYLWYKSKEKAYQDFSPGDFIPHDQIPTDLKSKFPNGIGENILSLTEEKQAQLKHNDYVVQNMDDNLLNKSAAYAGSISGTLLDPVGLAAGGGAASLVKSAEAVGIMTNLATSKLASGALEGTAVGIGASIPTSVSEYNLQKDIGENPEPLEVLSNIAINGAFGGGIGVVGKLIHPFIAPHVRNIVDTAKSQIEKSKVPDMSYPLDVAANASKQRILETSPNIIDELSEDNNKIIEDIKKNEQKYKPFVDGEKSLPSMLDKDINTLINGLSESPNSHIAELERNQELPYYRDILDTLSTHPNEWTPEQYKNISDLIEEPMYEQNKIKDDIDSLKEKVNINNESIKKFIDKNLEEYPNSPVKDYDFNSSKLSLFDQYEDDHPIHGLVKETKDNIGIIERLNKRLDELKESPKHDMESSAARYKNHINKNIMAHNDLVRRLASSDYDVSGARLMNEHRKVNTFESDAFMGPESEDALLSDQEDYARIAQDYRDKNMISEEEFNEINKLSKNSDRDFKKLLSALDNMIGCILGA